MKKTALALLLALLMAAALLTSGALASDDEAGPAAKVGNVEYDNFNDAMVRVVIQHFSKNTVISMVLGHPNSEITCIPPS